MSGAPTDDLRGRSARAGIELVDFEADVAAARAAHDAARASWAPCVDCGELTDPRRGARCSACVEARRRKRAVLGAAAIPERFAWATFAAPELAQRVASVQAIELARRWGGGDRLVLAGAVPGVGKTSLGVAVLRAQIDAGVSPALFVDAHQLASERGAFGREAGIVASALAARLLLIDDLGAEARDAAGAIERVIFDRFQRVRATVLTTALSAAEIGQRYGGALQRRLTEGATIVRVERTP